VPQQREAQTMHLKVTDSVERVAASLLDRMDGTIAWWLALACHGFLASGANTGRVRVGCRICSEP
jgi:hypothetical protein